MSVHVGVNASTRTVKGIDIVALGNGYVRVCECRYRSEPVRRDVMEAPIRRSELMRIDKPRRYTVFSRSGSTDDAGRFAESNGIDMYSLGDVAHCTPCARPHSLNKG